MKLGYRNSKGPPPSFSLFEYTEFVVKLLYIITYKQSKTIESNLLLLLLLQLLNSLSLSRVSSLHAGHSLEKVLLVVVEDVLIVLRVQT